ncbi:hypothetical protein EDB81DRAFT_950572 [Dactylonectria macrodidyma]|uniref:Nephrocystin 3-like N-terminal domain-containing protein n=1 Tax=Dactylonectria macrodidyma TaxID=307937 RepID=A0A9P9E541_9HYPO|nr:hypothetical protein EDB81DRAFT_950572 [Dactylonectria macrodidyma]
MDPINAFQVAAAVIGLVDFGSRLLSDTIEIYQSASGHTARDVELTTLSEDLSSLSEQLQNHLEAASSTSSASESTLRALSARSIDASNKLKSAIGELQANKPGSSKISTAANSLASALKAIWKKSEIEALKENLLEIRSQITITTLVSVWEETRQDGHRHGDLKDRLDQIVSKLDRRDNTAQVFAKELMQLTIQEDTSHVARKNANLVNTLWGIDRKFWASSQSGDLFSYSQSANVPKNGDLPISMKILTSLRFREIYAREEAIPEAYASTYNWIFRDEQSDENGEKLEWASFPEWLQKTDDSLYWITGKPGSGKSTLMKYIYQNPQLRDSLRNYAGDLPLMLAGFFFWNPGSESERSQEGLIRTILHQCLSERQDLIPLVTPRRWALYNLLGSETVAPDWKWRELKESFEALCSYHRKEFQLVLLIDGLDEFGEKGHSPGGLVHWIKDIITRHHVKVCVSSRPWNIFSDAFRKDFSLTMQSLTYKDIEHFVQTKFDDSVAFQELSVVFAEEANALLKEIIEKAEGVFLWVNLVVRSLLATLVDTPSLSHLQEKLAEIPRDMKGLYDNIWSSIPQERLATTSKIFQLLTLGDGNTNVIWLAIGESPHVVTDPVKRQGIPKVMKRILDGHTRGICELSSSGVRFLHRSAAEWIREDKMWEEIRSKSPPDFEPNMSLLESTVLHYSSDKSGVNAGLATCFDYVMDAFDFAYGARSSNRVSEDRLIQALDGVHRVTESFMDMDTQLSDSRKPTGGNPSSFSADIWLAYQFQDENRLECSYVSAAARAGLTFYVKSKVSQDKSLLLSQPNRISLLEAAIFDRLQPERLVQDSRLEYCRAAGLRPDRLDVIRFILEVDENRCMTGSGEDLYDTVGKFASGLGLDGNGDDAFVDEDDANSSDDEKWFTEVLTLLEQYGCGPGDQRKLGGGAKANKATGKARKGLKGGPGLFRRLVARLKNKDKK